MMMPCVSVESYRHVKKDRLRNPASWLLLAPVASSRNITFAFFDISVHCN